MAIGPLLRVARNVTDLVRICAFYVDALGFSVGSAQVSDPELAEMLGVDSVRSAFLRLGDQVIELTECHPAGAPYRRERQADDPCFQHIAIVTTDIHRACAQALNAGAVAISAGGPVLLPASSGGVWAWKFRDPDGHPLELLQFPVSSNRQALNLGYDHSALVVTDTARSIEFYTGLGLQLRHRHLNHGTEQDRLDGLEPSVVDVVSLASGDAPPHVELLGYARPAAGGALQPHDIAADRLVFGNTPGALALRRDPDGHFVLLDGRK